MVDVRWPELVIFPPNDVDLKGEAGESDRGDGDKWELEERREQTEETDLGM